MSQRLDKAATALERAWKIDPTNADAATNMIRVELGQGQGRDRMELWFARAMEADPDNYSACMEKLYYLEPKWYGSDEEMLKFGRACLATGNWDAGIPYVLVKAHLHVSQYTNDGWQQWPQAGYFQNDPSIWSEIRAVYAQDRQHRPRSVEKELQIARIAGWCGHWDEANQLYDEIGNAYDTAAIPMDAMNQAKAEARRHPPSTNPSRF
jgi:tetratricopeptide (TPR) repeat protein